MSGPSESVEEDESQTERICVSEKGAETAELSGQDKEIHERLAELLRNYKHEEAY